MKQLFKITMLAFYSCRVKQVSILATNSYALVALDVLFLVHFHLVVLSASRAPV